MGTRSMILKPEGDAWVGRYVHWDGYPEGVGAALHEIVNRDGLTMARKVLIDDHVYWSSIDPSMVHTKRDYSGNEVIVTEIDLGGIALGACVSSISYTDEKRWAKPATFVVGYGEADLNGPVNDEADEDFLITYANYSQYDGCEWAYLLSGDGLHFGRVPWGREATQPNWMGVIPWDADFSEALTGFMAGAE